MLSSKRAKEALQVVMSNSNLGPRERENLALPRLMSVRGAFKMHREARAKRKLWQFYVEHSLFEEATNTRTLVLQHLREAREHWRSALLHSVF